MQESLAILFFQQHMCKLFVINATYIRRPHSDVSNIWGMQDSKFKSNDSAKFLKYVKSKSDKSQKMKKSFFTTKIPQIFPLTQSTSAPDPKLWNDL